MADANGPDLSDYELAQETLGRGLHDLTQNSTAAHAPLPAEPPISALPGPEQRSQGRLRRIKHRRVIPFTANNAPENEEGEITSPVRIASSDKIQSRSVQVQLKASETPPETAGIPRAGKTNQVVDQGATAVDETTQETRDEEAGVEESSRKGRASLPKRPELGVAVLGAVEPWSAGGDNHREGDSSRVGRRAGIVSRGSAKSATEERTAGEGTGPETARHASLLKMRDQDIHLYDLFMSVNGLLAREMQKNNEVHDALSEELPGPLGSLGPVGRLVRLLHRSTQGRRRAEHQNRKAVPQASVQDTSTVHQPAASSPSHKAARELLSSTLLSHATMSMEGEESGGGHNIASGLDILKRPLFRDERKRRINLFDKHRQRDSVIEEAGDEEVENDWCDGDAKENNAGSGTSGRNTRTGPTSASSATDEEIEEMIQRARRRATEVVQDSVRKLTEERDAALYLVEKSTYERDIAQTERTRANEENERLRTFLQVLVEGTALDEYWPGDEENLAEAGDRRDTKHGSLGAETKEGQEERKSNEESEESCKDSAETSAYLVAGGTGEDSEHSAGAPNEEGNTRKKEPGEQPPTLQLGQLPQQPQPSQSQALQLLQAGAPLRTPLSRTGPEHRQLLRPNWPLRHQKLIDEARKLLHKPPPAQHPRPPMPSRRELGRLYCVTKRRQTLGPGLGRGILDVVISILCLIQRQRANLSGVGAWVRSASAGPLVATLKQVGGAVWEFVVQQCVPQWKGNRAAGRTSNAQSLSSFSPRPSSPRERLSAHLPPSPPPSPPPDSLTAEESTRPVQRISPTTPRVVSRTLRTPSFWRQPQASDLPPSPLRRAGLAASAWHEFPRDELAELIVCLFVLLAAVVLFCAIVERHLWLDHNGDIPRSYLYHYVVLHRPETDSCEAYLPSLAGVIRGALSATGSPLPSAPTLSPYHLCACMPTFVDLRFVAAPGASLLEYIHNWSRDAARYVAMWAAA